MSGLVVLLSDFGSSEYAGVMKGILARHPAGLRWCDLTHAVSPQGVREGAWILYTSYRYFPEGAVFLAVVDPGVGTSRQAVAVRTRGYMFVGPDNGLLWAAVQDDGGPLEAVALPVPPEASSTFHGRDVFAPAAARLAAGEPLAALGPPTTLRETLRFHRQGREGEVVRVDAFGNVVTNLPPVPGSDAYELELDGQPRSRRAAVRAVATYADGVTGEWVAVTGSAGTLEVAVVGGSASRRLKVQPGRKIRLEPVGEGGGPRA
ncbi:SAM hydrolase/SAM-dependent halogenase family protein [Limnochorda pilosa]|uniref:Adenosyl-chloride synthase n=1 Tax=Limnochorda pilosa TaxID=1555112 RepID=A0A0K2SG07_LIMPI|nr:SAM-dependent chlorinase/fluorinase [Limnochorda pilosa]BAS26038.1 hypothetical protein LIP_0181 [Limnochorda pilosa]